MRSPRFLLAVAAVGTVLLVLTGCRDREIATYRVPKETAPAPAATPPSNMGVMPGMAAPTTGIPKWDVPAGWQTLPLTGVRVGNFAINSPAGLTAEMAVTSFPGTVGGDLQNVNRWREQIHLPPIDEAALSAVVQSLTTDAGTFHWVDLVSDAPLIEGKHLSRILGAWLKQPGRVWFFKLSGEAALVATQREAFMAFLRSVRFDSETAAAPGGQIKPEAPPAAAPRAAAPGSTPPKPGALSWTAPADWSPKPLTSMRKGSFAVRTGSGEADLSIISFGGAAGGLTDNLNRWREQVRLPAVSAEEIKTQANTVEHGALRFTVVDYAGTTANGPTRIVGAVLSLENETYFFKLMGPDAVVAAQKPAFLEFLRSVRTP